MAQYHVMIFFFFFSFTSFLLFFSLISILICRQMTMAYLSHCLESNGRSPAHQSHGTREGGSVGDFSPFV